MRIYLNAQFADGRHRAHLLSVALVSELGEFYRVVHDPGSVERARKDPWLREHVLVRLPYEEDGRDWHWATDHEDSVRVSRPEMIAVELAAFVAQHRENDPQLWAWQGSYAYTGIRHLFGRITERPDGFPLWCGELAAEWHKLGQPELPPRAQSGHHALEQARWAQEADRILQGCLTMPYEQEGAVNA